MLGFFRLVSVMRGYSTTDIVLLWVGGTMTAGLYFLFETAFIQLQAVGAASQVAEETGAEFIRTLFGRVWPQVGSTVAGSFIVAFFVEPFLCFLRWERIQKLLFEPAVE